MVPDPTLAFVPCFSGAPWDTDRLAALAGRPLHTFRLPDGLADIEAYADALAAQVADLDDYVLVGDSFGANVALALAVRQPEHLVALVLSGGFASNPVTSPAWQNAMRVMGKLRGPLYRHVVLRAHAHRLASPHDAEGQVPWTKSNSRQLFLEHTPAASFGARVVAVLNADYTDRLDRVDIPTLIVTHSEDTLIGADAAQVLRNGIPDAQEVVLPRTGHMFRFTHPETYARAVAEFLGARGL